MPTYTGGGANKGDASTNTEPEAEATEPQATAKEPTTESGHAEALGE